jgi:ParB family chromosome partitioning protein
VSSPRRIGLPEALRMRHDTHFVDQLGRPAGVPVGRLIPTEDIDPNPNQPRQTLGDLSELVASIREKGVLEPILVRPRGSRFQIIAGERRYRACMDVGLAEIPCIVRETSDAEMMELALIENLQRKDLSAFEEADGLKVLAETYGYTHERMAEKIGRSRTSITETLSITAMPDDVRELCRLADIHSKSLLLQVVRQGDPRKMVALVEKITRDGGATREAVRRETAKPKPGRPKAYVFSYKAPTKAFKLQLRFTKSRVDRDEVISALEGIIKELRTQR